jgi:hypothetical protein
MSFRRLLFHFARIVTTSLILGVSAAAVESDLGPRLSIRVGPNVHVSRARPDVIHAEVVIAADPENSKHLLAGSMILPERGPAILPPEEDNRDDDSVIAYRSSDAGEHWELAFHKPAQRRGAKSADPAVAFGPGGSAYFAAVRQIRRKQQLELVSSRDGGKSWGEPIAIEQQVDRPFLTLDCSNSGYRSRLYCDYRLLQRSPGNFISVSVSSDGGKTLREPQALAIALAPGGIEPGPGAILSDGTFAFPCKATLRPSDGIKPGSYAIRLRRSRTGGESFLPEQSLFVRDFLGENMNSVCIPALAVDPGSTAFKDRLYLVWSETTAAGVQVLFSFSQDKGANWSQPAAISEQTVDAGGEGSHAVIPAVAVNTAGIVGISWYDTRGSQPRKPRCNVRLRVSANGGASWLPSVQVTDVPSHFDVNTGMHGEPVGNWLGHTAGLTSDSSGAFHPLWIDNRTGIPQVFTAKATVVTAARQRNQR